MSEQVVVPFAQEFEAVKQRNLWIDALERLIRNKMALFGLVVAAFLILLAIFGPIIAPYGYLDINLARVREPPSWEHWMGTDVIGRDVMSRMFHAARTAIFVAAITLIIGNLLGISLGAIAAYRGGWIDDLIMRFADVLFSFPDLLLAAFLSASLRAPVLEIADKVYAQTGWEFLRSTVYIDYTMVFGALAAVNWSGTARMIRGQILSLREQDFIRAELALGAPTWLIIRKHLIPNAMHPIIVGISAGVGGVMLLESSLSFLGLGIQPPGASWGNMIASNLDKWRYDPHLLAMPGIALAVAVFAFNFLGDGVNDALNPRQIRR